MSWLASAFYDRLMQASEEACLRQWRATLLDGLAGDVLEVGAGTGLNLPHYPQTIGRLVLSEPDHHMRHQLAQKVQGEQWQHVEIVNASLHDLPFASNAFNAVVATLVLCSVQSLDRALAEITRVLKPEGRFVFLEHVAAEGRPQRLKWQRRVEPLWKRLAGNCHLTRRTAGAIAASGLSIVQMDRESMRKAWPLVRPTIRGVAVKPL